MAACAGLSILRSTGSVLLPAEELSGRHLRGFGAHLEVQCARIQLLHIHTEVDEREETEDGAFHCAAAAVVDFWCG